MDRISATAGNVKQGLPPRQSRGVSHDLLEAMKQIGHSQLS